MRARGASANLDHGRTQIKEGVWDLGVLVEAGGDADGVCERVVEDGDGENGRFGDDAWGTGGALARVKAELVQELEGARAGVVGLLCVGDERAEERWDEPLVDRCPGVGRVEVEEVERGGEGGGENDGAKGR